MLTKMANLLRILKKESKQLVNNYKPISLLPICDKMFEYVTIASINIYQLYMKYIIHLIKDLTFVECS